MASAVRVARTGLGLAWRADAKLTVALSATVLVQSVVGPLFALALRELTSAVIRQDPSTATTWAIALAVNLCAGPYLGTKTNDLGSTLGERTSLALSRELMRSTATMPGLEHHERPDYLDRMQLLQRDAGVLVSAMPSMVQALGLVIEAALTLGLLMALHPALVLLPLLAVPSLWAGWLSQRRQQRTAQANAEPQRLLEHLYSLALDARRNKELRIFGAIGEVQARWRRTWDAIERRQLTTQAHTSVASTAATLVFVSGQIGAILLVTAQARRGAATAGDVVLVITLAGRVSGLVARVVGTATAQQALVQAVTRYLWLQDYETAVHADHAGRAEPPTALRRGIELRAVTFRYPGTDVDVLRDVDLVIPAGCTVAIVGENGAGKTTLVKLLCRFYHPTSGQVVVDDEDLRTLDVGAWRRRTSAAFQDVLRLELTAREAVGVGDLALAESADAVNAALDRAGATDVVAGMPNGLDTQLGRDWAGGIELSGGQWQKLGLARAMMRPTPLLLILDEPTSALDPQSEHALFQRYSGAAAGAAKVSGAITILVSHRFSTVRMADIIVVIDDGSIRETGTHAELMTAGGLYAELFTIQASAYS